MVTFSISCMHWHDLAKNKLYLGKGLVIIGNFKLTHCT